MGGVCVDHSVVVKVRRQLEGVGSPLLCGSRGWNSFHGALPTEPSCQPYVFNTLFLTIAYMYGMCWDHISPHYPALFHSCWPSSFPQIVLLLTPMLRCGFFYCNGYVIPRRQHFIVSPSSSPYGLSTTFSVMSPRPWKQLCKSCLGLNTQQSLFLSMLTNC